MNKKCFVVTNPNIGWDNIICVYLAVSKEDVYQMLYEARFGEMDDIKSNYELLEKHFEEIPSKAEIREQKIDEILKNE